MGGTFVRIAGNTGTLELHCIYHCFIFYHIVIFSEKNDNSKYKNIPPEKINI